MREIRLYGHLGDTFGTSFKLDVASPAEAIAALCANFKDFATYLRKHSAPGYRVLVGDVAQERGDLTMRSEGSVIKIIPVVAGSGGGVLQTILGIVLVVVGVVFEMPMVAQAGVAMIVGGVVTMLMSTPKNDAVDKDNIASYSFNGAVNTVSQGNPVPICYGELIVGSQVISAGISTDQIPIGYKPGGGLVNKVVNSLLQP